MSIKETSKIDKAGRVIGKIELILFIIVVLAFIMKILLNPFGTTFFVFGLMLLGSVYFPVFMLYAIISKQYTGAAKAMLVLAALALSTGAMGILYKVQAWPLADTMLMAGIVMLLPLAVASVVLLAFKNEGVKNATRWILPRAVICLLPSTFFIMVTQTQFYSMYGKYKDNPKYMKLHAQCMENHVNCAEFREYFMELEISEIEEQVKQQQKDN